MRRLIFGVVTHAVALGIGFALGVYLLPVLTAPPAPDAATLEQGAQDALYSAEFTRELRGSDFLHWGEGRVSLTPTRIVHEGRLAPRPDYKPYLVKDFVEHEEEFPPAKAEARLIGDVKTFGGFLLEVPDGVELTDDTTVLIWCESFSEFITAARCR